MAKESQGRERRRHALSRQRIVEAAIDILDAHGEAALTFRALATSLETGAGAIYWHVVDKRALLAAAADHLVGRAVGALGDEAEPQTAIRAIALAMFDAFDAHPWIGAQLSAEPGQTAMTRFLEGIGGRLPALDVPKSARFDAWSALINYILGVAGQNAANARRRRGRMDREAVLSSVAAGWARLDAAEYPFLREVAVLLPGHDDRAQFVAGIDLILAGIRDMTCKHESASRTQTPSRLAAPRSAP